MTDNKDFLAKFKFFLDALDEDQFRECASFLLAYSYSGGKITVEEYLNQPEDTLDDDDDDDEEYDDFDDPEEIDGEPTDRDDKWCYLDRVKPHIEYSPMAAGQIKDLTLRIELEGIEPVIWREIEVPSNLILESLAQLIVKIMGWGNEHMHHFFKGNCFYEIPDNALGLRNPFGFMATRVKGFDSRTFTVGQLLSRVRSWISFEYDFGDSWQHRVTVTAVKKHEPGTALEIRGIDGRRACPPEDCGGVCGYEEFMNELAKPKRRRNPDMMDWLGDYDPEEFDLDDWKRNVEYLNELAQ